MKMNKITAVLVAFIISIYVPFIFIESSASQVDARKIVVISNETNISMGIVESDFLYPFPDPETKEVALQFGKNIVIRGQLVDGDYVPVWSCDDAFLLNRGVEEPAEIRWWFGNKEMPPIKVDEKNGVKGFFCFNFIVDEEIAPMPGYYSLRFEFNGIIKKFEDIGEIMIYPPCSIEFKATVIFKVNVRLDSYTYSSKPGGHITISGKIYDEMGRPVDALLSTEIENTYPGVFIDEVSVIDYDSVIYAESFNANSSSASVLLDDLWSIGKKEENTCIGTFNGLPGLSIGSACLRYINLTSTQKPVLKLRLWIDIGIDDVFSIRIKHKGMESNIIIINYNKETWNDISIPLDKFYWRGLNRTVLGYDNLEIIFEVKSFRYSFESSEGEFRHTISVPEWKEGEYYISLRYLPDGPYTIGCEKIEVSVVKNVNIEFLDYNLSVGWLSVDFLIRTVDDRIVYNPSLANHIWGFVRSSSGSIIDGKVISSEKHYRFVASVEKTNDKTYEVHLHFNGTSFYSPTYATINVSKEENVKIVVAAISREKYVYVYGFIMKGDIGVYYRDVMLKVYSDGEIIYEHGITTNEIGRFEETFPIDFSLKFIKIVVQCENSTSEVYINCKKDMYVIYESIEIKKGESYILGKITSSSGEGIPYLPIRLQIILPQGYIEIGNTYTFPDGKFYIQFTYDWKYPLKDVKIKMSTPYGNLLNSEINVKVRCNARIIPFKNEIKVENTRTVLIEGKVVEDWDGKEGYPIKYATVHASLYNITKIVKTDSVGHFVVYFRIQKVNKTSMCILKYTGGSLYSKSSAEVLIKSIYVEKNEKILVKKPVKKEDNMEKISVGGLIASIISFALISIFVENAKLKILFLFVPLYSKIKRDEVLDQFVRGQVYGYIKTHPGDHFNEIKRQLGLSNGTLSYHLRVLESQEYIWSRSDGMYRRYYPSEIPKSRDMRRLSGNETQNTILKIIDKEPGISLKEIAKIMKTSHQVVSYHINMLTREGRIHVKKCGKKKICYPNGHKKLNDS